MTKTIINIIQNDSGGTNPDTHAHEDKVWELQFEDEDSAVLTKGKMLEYLTKGTVPVKTVHSFKKWDITTTSGHTIRTWVVVYDDKSHVQLTNKDFYSLLTHGHSTLNGEEVATITTPEEQLELKEFREHVTRDEYSPVFDKKEEANIEE